MASIVKKVLHILKTCVYRLYMTSIVQKVLRIFKACAFILFYPFYIFIQDEEGATELWKDCLICSLYFNHIILNTILLTRLPFYQTRTSNHTLHTYKHPILHQFYETNFLMSILNNVCGFALGYLIERFLDL